MRHHLRFHIRTVAILIVFLAVSLAALRQSNEIWDSGTFTFTVTVLLTSAVLAIHRTERKRAFWLGFVLFGTTYLVLFLIPPIEARLLTTKALAFLGAKMPAPSPIAIQLGSTYLDLDSATDLALTNNPVLSAIYRNKGNGTFEDITPSVVLNRKSNQIVNTVRLWILGSTEHFIHIGHSLTALLAAILGGYLSRHLHDRTT